MTDARPAPTRLLWAGPFLSTIEAMKEPVAGGPPEPTTTDGWIDALLDRLDLAVYSIDHARQVIVQANSTFARMFGFPSAEAAIGRSVLDIYTDPKERAEIAARLDADPVFRATGRAHLTLRRRRQDTGESFDLGVLISARFGADGKVVWMDGLVDPAPGGLARERAFRASEERFRQLFDTSVVAMALTDPAGRLQRVNAAFCRLVGRGEAELVGRPFAASLHPDDSHAAMPPPASATGSVAEDVRVARPDALPVWGAASWSWLLGEDGEPHSAVLILQDVTARRSADEDRMRAAKLEALGSLAAHVAHGFNNVLAAAMGSVTLAGDLPGAGPDVQVVLREAETAILRARDMTRQLVTFAKGGAPHRQPADLGVLVRRVVARLGEEGRRVELRLDGDVPQCSVDEHQIAQALTALVAATPAGGHAVVNVASAELDATSPIPLPAGRYVAVTVSDAGRSLTADERRQRFDPIQALSTTGESLALAAAWSIVRRHDGHLAPEETCGAGNRTTFYLPAIRDAAAPPAPVLEPPPRLAPSAAPPVASAVAARRLLVMDDDDMIRRIVGHILREAGYEVDLTPDGDQAVAAFEAALREGTPYAAVVLDLTVPGGHGGLWTLRRLKALDADVRALVASGYSDDPVMAEWRRHGFAGVLSKPYSADQLRAAVRELAGAPAPPAATR